MRGYQTLKGVDVFLNTRDPETWDITVRLERHDRHCSTDASTTFQTRVYDRWDDKAAALQLRQTAITDEKFDQIIDNVKTFDKWTGERLRTKREALSTFPFRVLLQAGHEPQLLDQKRGKAVSFICLSYSWWSSWINDQKIGQLLSPALRVDPYHGNFDIPRNSFPISDCMWNAFMAERATDAEGLWVDQLCIDQTDASEVHSSVSCMNIVYHAARKVVVVFEDVIFWIDEARALIKHAKEINEILPGKRDKWAEWIVMADILVRGASASAMCKIEGSRWFRRVWCNHELQMGTDFVFMIPVMEREIPPEGENSICVLKMDAKALITLLRASRLLAKMAGSSINDVLWRGWRNEVMEDFHIGDEPRVFYGINAATRFSHDLNTPELLLMYQARGWRPLDRSTMQIMGDMFSFDEQSPRDLLAVILNLVAPTVAYSGKSIPTMSEVIFMINVISLVIGDASPLMSATPLHQWRSNLIEGMPFSRYSWAAYPSLNSIGPSVGVGALLDLKCHLVNEGLKLVVAGAGSSHVVRQVHLLEDILHDSGLVGMNENLVRFDRLVKQQNKINQSEDDKSIEDDNDIMVATRYLQHLVHVLLMVRFLGPDWMLKCANELSELGLFTTQGSVVDAMNCFDEAGEDFRDLDFDIDNEKFSRLRDLLPTIRPFMEFGEVLVHFLLGEEYQFKNGFDDEGLVISTMMGGNPEGDEWHVITALPSTKEHGFFWVVQPNILVEATAPGAREDVGTTLDFRSGGMWAVQAEIADSDLAESMKLWDRLDEHAEDIRNEPQEDAIPMKLLSRNIRQIPEPPWFRPMYTKTVVLHG